MSETMEEMDRLRAEVEELTGNNEALEETNRRLREERNRIVSESEFGRVSEALESENFATEASIVRSKMHEFKKLRSDLIKDRDKCAAESTERWGEKEELEDDNNDAKRELSILLKVGEAERREFLSEVVADVVSRFADRETYISILEERKVDHDRQYAGMTKARNRFCGSVNRLAHILGMRGKDSYAPEAVERKTRLIVEEYKKSLDYAEFMNTQAKERDRQIETLEGQVEEFEGKIAKRDDYVARLELDNGTKDEVIAMLKEKLDKGETFEDFSTRIMELIEEGEPRRSLKRLATFMKYTLGLVRENRELGEKNITLDAENSHLSESIDAMNATLQGMNGAVGEMNEAVAEIEGAVEELPDGEFVEVVEKEGADDGSE